MEHMQNATSGITLEEIIPSYGEKLLRYATSILCSHQDAEDVVQDVFISYFQNGHRYDIQNLSAWLYKSTYHLCLNRIKSTKRRRLLFFEDMKSPPAVYMEDNLAMSEIKAVLQRLKPQERALLYGRVVDGHSYEALSRILGPSPAALRKQYERVKKKAAQYLDAHGYGQAASHPRPGLCAQPKGRGGL